MTLDQSMHRAHKTHNTRIAITAIRRFQSGIHARWDRGARTTGDYGNQDPSYTQKSMYSSILRKPYLVLVSMISPNHAFWGSFLD